MEFGQVHPKKFGQSCIKNKSIKNEYQNDNNECILFNMFNNLNNPHNP